MRKLMFTAALAATGMTFAAQPAAQVYDVTLNIKSTAAATATKINNKANPLAVKAATDDPSDIIYRKQASYTWKGLIWGCDCMAIDGVWEIVVPCNGTIKNIDTVKGCIIWDTKSKDVMYVGDTSTIVYDDEDDLLPDVSQVPGTGFGWDFLHCINKDGKQIEALWSMEQNKPICDKETAELAFSFVGAGFGTVNPVVLTSDKYEDPTTGKDVVDYSWDCSSYIKKISGNFAGMMWAPSLQTKDSASGCVYCGGTYVKGDCAAAYDVWAWCEDFGGTCGCDIQLFAGVNYTAAYGTWTVAYNSSVSKKLSTLLDVKKIEQTTVYSITQAYNFKNLPKVEAMIDLIEAEVLGKTKPEECEDLEKALDTATKNLKTAQEIAKAVQYENLKADVDAAADEVAKCEQALKDANTAYSTASDKYTQYKDEAYDQVFFTTNSTWEIDYLNKSSLPAIATGTGLEKFDAANEELKGFTLTDASFGGTVFATPTYANLNAYVVAQNTKTTTLIAKRDQAQDDVATAAQNVKNAKEARDDALVDLTEATNRYENRVYLQVEAAKNLEKAETAYDVAQKAAKDAGCID